MKTNDTPKPAKPLRPIETLTCCCCGGATRGRQWWNRDNGYGLCPSCADGTMLGEDVEHLAGKRGVHWDVKEETA